MHNASLGSIALLVLSTSCAARSVAPPVSADLEKWEAPTNAAPTSAPEAAASAEHRASRHVGDFSVHMISGAFRKQPALLTERVVGREGQTWIVEYRLEDTTGARGVRVWIDDNGEANRVIRLSDAGEEPGVVADYDALMASVSVVPDENDGLTASTNGTCTIGPSELDCETKNYRIWLGDKEANLGITTSAKLPDRDLAGQITAADGTVIFRSELLEQGNDGESRDDSFALLADPSATAESRQ